MLDALKVPNKVMSGYVDNCILEVLKLTTFKPAIPLIMAEIRDCKNKLVRERCLDYLNEMLGSWEITDREADVVADAVKLGLEDASVRARELGRSAYLALFTKFPKKTEKIKLTLTTTLRSRLTRAETEYTNRLAQPVRRSTRSSIAKGKENGSENVSPGKGSNIRPAVTRTRSAYTPATTPKTKLLGSKSEKSIVAPDSAHQSNAEFFNTIGFSNLGEGEDDIDFMDDSSSLVAERGSVENPLLPVRRRESFQDIAVTSIQAVVRGSLVRRNSLQSSSRSSSSGKKLPSHTESVDDAPSHTENVDDVDKDSNEGTGGLQTGVEDAQRTSTGGRDHEQGSVCVDGPRMSNACVTEAEIPSQPVSEGILPSQSASEPITSIISIDSSKCVHTSDTADCDKNSNVSAEVNQSPANAHIEPVMNYSPSNARPISQDLEKLQNAFAHEGKDDLTRESDDASLAKGMDTQAQSVDEQRSQESAHETDGELPESSSDVPHTQSHETAPALQHPSEETKLVDACEAPDSGKLEDDRSTEREVADGTMPDRTVTRNTRRSTLESQEPLDDVSSARKSTVAMASSSPQSATGSTSTSPCASNSPAQHLQFPTQINLGDAVEVSSAGEMMEGSVRFVGLTKFAPG
jgi:hypothetical protein